MDLRRKLRRTFSIFRPVPVKPSHTYRDRVTGEYFTVESVGRQVQIRRHDAEDVEEWSVHQDVLRRAIKKGVVEHDEDVCEVCQ
jgi:hypothetical protein